MEINRTDRAIPSLLQAESRADFTRVESDGRITLGTGREGAGETTKNSTVQLETDLR
ncbi:hypothetical protein [Natrinema sp. DC36]|uniref:hypothetical protein n=1 Tax=Natrinema sp. DC36 TaxID=2878680 RepID=UPI001CF0A9CC|nr:hypothetical protein [Natrinema sp. DC36]